MDLHTLILLPECSFVIRSFLLPFIIVVPVVIVHVMQRRSERRSERRASQVEQVFSPAEDASTWQHIPLAFALVPAIGGLFFTGGPHFITDAMLLGLVSFYLHYLVKLPWEWYKSVQLRRLDGSDGTGGQVVDEHETKETMEEETARRELEWSHDAALVLCFAGPLLGGLLLSYIRSSLSRPSEGLVSSFNITLFVIAAEVRPAAQVVALVRARAWRLQEIIHAPPQTAVDRLGARVVELEEALASVQARMAAEEERDVVGQVRGDLSPGIEALTRAVRRYEKREALTAAWTSSKVRELERRLEQREAGLGPVLLAPLRMVWHLLRK